MSWAYKSFDDDNVDTVISSIESELADLATADSDTASVTAKVAISDQESGDARGLVFYNLTLGGIPSVPSGQLSWSKKEETTKNDYTDMYNNIQDKLNSLSDQSAYWAKIGFTNRKDGSATLTLYWPES